MIFGTLLASDSFKVYSQPPLSWTLYRCLAKGIANTQIAIPKSHMGVKEPMSSREVTNSLPPLTHFRSVLSVPSSFSFILLFSTSDIGGGVMLPSSLFLFAGPVHYKQSSCPMKALSVSAFTCSFLFRPAMLLQDYMGIGEDKRKK